MQGLTFFFTYIFHEKEKLQKKKKPMQLMEII